MYVSSSREEIRALTFCDRSDMVEPVSWHHTFAEPIELPKGKKLVTLCDALAGHTNN
jgi:hypothetical protein